MMRHLLLFALSLLLLNACGSQSSAPAPGPTATSGSAPLSTPTAAAPAATPVAARAPRSCADELGAAAAAKRVEVCRNVSPATHPPCNAANSCALIEDEIARSCALATGDGAPMRGCGPDPRGAQAAADVVHRYYSAIDAGDYSTAWTQWGPDGRPGQSFAAFRHGFDHTASTRVTIGALPPVEGAAGSSYLTVPVTVEAMLDDGKRQRFVGNYVVRRVNDVDGATAEQRRWHLESAQLRPVG
jgi:hypothetical protein